jgi:hypothetical protein
LEIYKTYYKKWGDRSSPPLQYAKSPSLIAYKRGIFVCGTFIGILNSGLLLPILAGVATVNSSRRSHFSAAIAPHHPLLLLCGNVKMKCKIFHLFTKSPSLIGHKRGIFVCGTFIGILKSGVFLPIFAGAIAPHHRFYLQNPPL